MSYIHTTSADDLSRSRFPAASAAADSRPLDSAVSWGAIAAGAAAAAALSLILLILGVGFGLSTVSPWAREGISAGSFGVSTIVWLTVTQLLASAMGGFLAGRLRTKWTELHSDEVYFRDTAHGFLAWAAATLATAALLGSVIASILSGGTQIGAATVAAGGTSAAQLATKDSGAKGYFVDSLFRRNPSSNPSSTDAAVAASAAATNGEVNRIFTNVSWTEPLPLEDIRYLGQIVAQRTGLTQQDAEKRVSEVYARAQIQLRDAEVTAREAADKARKASAWMALWVFVSLLIGAFVASLAATFGGRLRDA